MGRCWIGCALLVMGLALALLGGPVLGPDLHPVATGLISVGLVMAGAGLVERRLDGPRAPRGTRSATKGQPPAEV